MWNRTGNPFSEVCFCTIRLVYPLLVLRMNIVLLLYMLTESDMALFWETQMLLGGWLFSMIQMLISTRACHYETA